MCLSKKYTMKNMKSLPMPRLFSFSCLKPGIMNNKNGYMYWSENTILFAPLSFVRGDQGDVEIFFY